jgi:hypothetical protein
MRAVILVLVLASSYFVEWIPNNATTPPPPPSTNTSQGEFPWQLSQ